MTIDDIQIMVKFLINLVAMLMASTGKSKTMKQWQMLVCFHKSNFLNTVLCHLLNSVNSYLHILTCFEKLIVIKESSIHIGDFLFIATAT